MDVGCVMANEMLEIFVHFWTWRNFFCFVFCPPFPRQGQCIN